MKSTRASLALALLLACGGAFAQQAAIERQMTPEEFKAAGLDKLSPQELANLDAWLNHTLETETSKAATNAKTKFEDENRGFWHFNSDEPIVAHIVGEFRGFGAGKTYVLDNGQEWRQIDGATLVGVRKTDPAVRLTPSIVGNAWYLGIDGYGTRTKVQRVK
jgi:hypothetical protein